jgi:GTP-binding protein YchF
MLTTGIIGLPNVGKSSLFNALTAGQANVSNYPFTTIESNVGMAAVPDERLDALARALDLRESTPCSIEYFDIAGLVEGASRGEGLGNQFLGEIRSVDAIVHVLRCFSDEEVVHVMGEADPVRDAGLVETELLLADLELLEGAIERRRRSWKADPGKHLKEEERLYGYLQMLADGVPLRGLELDRRGRRELKALGLLSGKPVVYVANLGEEEYGSTQNAIVEKIREMGPWPDAGRPATVVPVSARLDWELQQLEREEEREEFMLSLGIERSGLERLVEATFDCLGLVRFYTLANEKLRAWEIERGTTAARAAGKVHTDMEKGFIKAQVAPWDEVTEEGSLHGLHERGRLRTEGRDYPVQDGDVVEFLFSR